VERLVAIVKRHPLPAAIAIVVLGTMLGTLFGWAYAYQAVDDITKARRPGDPLDMLTFVALMYLALGFFGGALAGLFAGSVVYFLNRKRA